LQQAYYMEPPGQAVKRGKGGRWYTEVGVMGNQAHPRGG
jgi:hypothetical protein